MKNSKILIFILAIILLIVVILFMKGRCVREGFADADADPGSFDGDLPTEDTVTNLLYWDSADYDNCTEGNENNSLIYWFMLGDTLNTRIEDKYTSWKTNMESGGGDNIGLYNMVICSQEENCGSKKRGDNLSVATSNDKMIRLLYYSFRMLLSPFIELRSMTDHMEKDTLTDGTNIRKYLRHPKTLDNVWYEGDADKAHRNLKYFYYAIIKTKNIIIDGSNNDNTDYRWKNYDLSHISVKQDEYAFKEVHHTNLNNISNDGEGQTNWDKGVIVENIIASSGKSGDHEQLHNKYTEIGIRFLEIIKIISEEIADAYNIDEDKGIFKTDYGKINNPFTSAIKRLKTLNNNKLGTLDGVKMSNDRKDLKNIINGVLIPKINDMIDDNGPLIHVLTQLNNADPDKNLYFESDDDNNNNTYPVHTHPVQEHTHPVQEHDTLTPEEIQTYVEEKLTSKADTSQMIKRARKDWIFINSEDNDSSAKARMQKINKFFDDDTDLKDNRIGDLIEKIEKIDELESNITTLSDDINTSIEQIKGKISNIDIPSIDGLLKEEDFDKFKETQQATDNDQDKARNAFINDLYPIEIDAIKQSIEDASDGSSTNLNKFIEDIYTPYVKEQLAYNEEHEGEHEALEAEFNSYSEGHKNDHITLESDISLYRTDHAMMHATEQTKVNNKFNEVDVALQKWSNQFEKYVDQEFKVKCYDDSQKGWGVKDENCPEWLQKVSKGN